jgi:hypothetical protein
LLVAAWLPLHLLSWPSFTTQPQDHTLAPAQQQQQHLLQRSLQSRGTCSEV